MSLSALSRYRAERLLRKEFSALRSKVLAIVRSQLHGKGLALDHADLEACYAQAWHGLYATVLAGERVENPSAWLVTVTFRRAIDESRSIARTPASERHADAFDLDLATDWRRGASDRDFAAELDDRAQLRHLFEGLRVRLSARECEAASLCYLQGLSRAEAAEQMGISETRMRKLMEGAGSGRPGVAAKVGGLLDTIKAGDWCEQQSSLMRALGFGLLEPGGERHALALAHCRACPACRAHVALLRGLASVLPLPLFRPFAFAGGVGATTSGATGTGSSGFAGSLAAKLAVTAAVVLGTGYAVLGSRAHGGPPARHAAILPAVASDTLLQTPPIVRFRRTRTARRPVAHVRTSHRAHPTSQLPPAEFGPERVQIEPVGATVHSSRTVNEFGIE